MNAVTFNTDNNVLVLKNCENVDNKTSRTTTYLKGIFMNTVSLDNLGNGGGGGVKRRLP
jgi:Ribonuclease G/E